MTLTPNEYNPLLVAIAKALGEPVAAFYAASETTAGKDLIALIQAWMAIRDEQSRHRVLSFAQHEAGRATEVPSSPRENVATLKIVEP